MGIQLNILYSTNQPKLYNNVQKSLATLNYCNFLLITNL